MEKLSSLTAAGNTYNPCLLVLRDKGYSLSAEEEGEMVIYRAEKGGHWCAGYSPPELLGIVTLWETFGADWNRQKPNLLSEIPRNGEE